MYPETSENAQNKEERRIEGTFSEILKQERWRKAHLHIYLDRSTAVKKDQA
jgi:hypothetical protein